MNYQLTGDVDCPHNWTVLFAFKIRIIYRIVIHTTCPSESQQLWICLGYEQQMAQPTLAYHIRELIRRAGFRLKAKLNQQIGAEEAHYNPPLCQSRRSYFCTSAFQYDQPQPSSFPSIITKGVNASSVITSSWPFSSV